MKNVRRRLVQAGLAVATAAAAVLGSASPALALSRTCYTDNFNRTCSTANLYSSAQDWVRLTTFPVGGGGANWCRLFDADNGQQVADLWNDTPFTLSETTWGLYGRYYAICQIQYQFGSGSSGGRISNS